MGLKKQKAGKVCTNVMDIWDVILLFFGAWRGEGEGAEFDQTVKVTFWMDYIAYCNYII